MDFSFGIITGGNNEQLIEQIITSIRAQNIPNYEIIIVGACEINGDDIKQIEFNENIKPMWITKKKNIISQISKYENIVFLHDYIIFEPGWYDGHIKSGNQFDVRMDKIINLDRSRFRDWCVWPHNNNEMDKIIGRNCLIPYNINLTGYMYISGSYWVAKKNFMLQNPLDEALSWGQGEDVRWSVAIREKTIFNMNELSTVKLLKQKDPVFFQPDDHLNKILIKYDKINNI